MKKKSNLIQDMCQVCIYFQCYYYYYCLLSLNIFIIIIDNLLKDGFLFNYVNIRVELIITILTLCHILNIIIFIIIIIIIIIIDKDNIN